MEKRRSKDLDLENDLLLSSNDLAFMRKNNSQDAQDLESYLDFLDDIDAFKSKKKIKTEFYKAEFEL
ncbi:MAG: hypothetical protein JRI35_08270 [Deltaproteobacteria bacterium]|nr:hypothetical protein [Deltaproteobacteria bacterium]MBW1947422.1 hypothetical protein [Deltaproteobacteria bacterium]MBW1966902.1 hypothetical protein [Deltaproteobacteria bacterium]MBW2097993.1 hypothetical protein [Deltaproteobacteria bacterium]